MVEVVEVLEEREEERGSEVRERERREDFLLNDFCEEKWKDG